MQTTTVVQASASTSLRDRNVKGLFELMDRRTELRGVHPVADHLVETVTWAV